MLLILMDKWYHSLPTAGNCRQSPLRLSNPEPWFMRIGLFWMGMNFHTAFPNGQDSWILDAKQFFGQFVLINPQAESLPTAIGPRREDKIATGKVIVLHLAQMLHLKSQFFPKRKNPLRFLKKKKQQLIFRQDSRVLGPICQKADSTKTIFLKICSFFPIFLTTFGTESRHSDRDILQVVLRSN